MILTSSPMNDTLKPRLVADRTLNKFALRHEEHVFDGVVVPSSSNKRLDCYISTAMNLKRFAIHADPSYGSAARDNADEIVKHPPLVTHLLRGA